MVKIQHSHADGLDTMLSCFWLGNLVLGQPLNDYSTQKDKDTNMTFYHISSAGSIDSRAKLLFLVFG